MVRQDAATKQAFFFKSGTSCRGMEEKGFFVFGPLNSAGHVTVIAKAINPQTKTISNKATKSICEAIRQWNLQRRTDKSLDELAKMINPIIKGWINYYGRFRKSALYRTFQHLNNILVRWANRKYKRLRGHKRRAFLWLESIVHRQPSLFAHWQLSQIKAGQ